MKRLIVLIVLLTGSPLSPARAEQPSCRAVLAACQQWCRDQRSGPERYVCKANCRSEFNAALSTGIFRREDGFAVRCSAIPHVVWRSRRRLRIFGQL